VVLAAFSRQPQVQPSQESDPKKGAVLFMAEAAQRRLQSALESTLDSVDKAHLRPMQKAAYLCMSKVRREARRGREGGGEEKLKEIFLLVL
jgi:hypothetical protein